MTNMFIVVIQIDSKGSNLSERKKAVKFVADL